jgi:predicted nucleotidyltransferase
VTAPTRNRWAGWTVRIGHRPEYAPLVPSLPTASLDAAERRALQRFVGLLRERFAEDLEGVWLYGPRARGDRPREESELRLLVLLRDSSRRDRATALELLWEAALTEGATESYFSIRISDRASPERRRAIDEFRAREVEPDSIALFTRPGFALGPTVR